MSIKYCASASLSLLLLFLLPLLAFSVPVTQDIATKGSITGRVQDPTGAVIPNTTVTVSGPTGDRTTTTNDVGDFEVGNLIPGSYKVKAEFQGFKTVTVSNVAVFVGRATALRLAMQVGDITQEVEIVAAQQAALDLSSTAVGANLNNNLYENLPLQRSVTSLFYLAPGANDGLGVALGGVGPQGGGGANPSVSGGSMLDNSYIADGVNITDAAFGGIGGSS